MMLFHRLVKVLLCLTLTIVITLNCLIPGIEYIPPAYAVNLDHSATPCDFATLNSSTDWEKVGRSVIDAVRDAHESTEDFAIFELDVWVNDLMKKVDDNFLSWYFSYGNQKAMEFGMPFAWLAFAGEYSLNPFRKVDEKKLNPNQVLKSKMIEDFQNKFTELVLNPESAQGYLELLAERVGRNYASALGRKLEAIKCAYKIPDGEWKRYLNSLATVVYDAGDSRGSLSAESMSSSLTTDLLLKTTVGLGGKLTLNFAAKAAAKIAAKAGGAIATKVVAQLVDPILAVGILIWDTWDYNLTVEESRPGLRQNILDYLNEVKLSIFNAPENSIMAAIEQVEGKIITDVESRSTS